jgi:3(or 17)beta-hydroxysteroid dehydrogenase
MGRMDGKVAIVTGAASGLGAADAQRLAEEGATVIMTDINDEVGTALAKDYGAHYFHQDVSDEATWALLVADTLKNYGRLDVLVNNAGIAYVANIEETTTQQWRRTLAIHLDATFFGCQAAIPAMQQGGGGSIINMSSTAALVGIAPYLAYSAAKGGIRAMTKSIAIHCRQVKNGIRCNSVHPGSISTPMVHQALESLQGFKLLDQDDPEATRKAMGIGEPLDIANMVLFLASDESKHVTGAEMVVDNGDTVI